MAQKVAKLWNYFDKCQDGTRTAVCHYCDNKMSYKSTMTNLKKHLEKRHPLVYEDLVNEPPLTEEPHDDSFNQSSKLWDIRKYFEQETDRQVRCVVCCVILSQHVKKQWQHLRENHPKLAWESTRHHRNAPNKKGEGFKDMSFNGKEQKGEHSDMEYSEDESGNSFNSLKRTSHQQTATVKKMKIRKSSFSSDEFLREKADYEHEEQLEKFGTYIMSLLKNTPRNVCAKLQMDIINLIMKAKLPSETVVEKKVTVDSVSVAIQTESSIEDTEFLLTQPDEDRKSFIVNLKPY